MWGRHAQARARTCVYNCVCVGNGYGVCLRGSFVVPIYPSLSYCWHGSLALFSSHHFTHSLPRSVFRKVTNQAWPESNVHVTPSDLELVHVMCTRVALLPVWGGGRGLSDPFFPPPYPEYVIVCSSISSRESRQMLGLGLQLPLFAGQQEPLCSHPINPWLQLVLQNVMAEFLRLKKLSHPSPYYF